MKARTDRAEINFVFAPDTPTAGKQLCFGWGDERRHVSEQVNLLEAVMAPSNIRLAWAQVKANGGAAGIDGMSLSMFPQFWQKHYRRIIQAVIEGNYKPAAVRRVYIPKPNGDKRPLGIPTVLDRVIQQAIAQCISPLFEPDFSQHSYGFRPNRSAHEAINAVQQNAQKDYTHVVDCDLKSFFDTVNHQKLHACLVDKIKDERVLRLITKYLKAGTVMPDGTCTFNDCGVPQGGPLSPLLSNILLDNLDKELETRGHKFVRYADDFLVQVCSSRAAKRVMKSLTRFLSEKLKVTVNQDKSKTTTVSKCEFLGFIINKKRMKWTGKSLERFKQRIKEITARSSGISMGERIKQLRLYLTGWLNYFWPGVVYKELLKLDKWIRRRVRLCYWKQWKLPRTRRRNLIKLGIPKEEVHKASRSRKGYWRMAGNSIVHRAITVEWLKQQGLPSIKELWIHLRYPEQTNLG